VDGQTPVTGMRLDQVRWRTYAILMLCAPGLFALGVSALLSGRGYALTGSEKSLLSLASWAQWVTPLCLVPAVVMTWRDRRRGEIEWVTGVAIAIAIAVGLFVTFDLARSLSSFVFPPPMDTF